MMTTATPSNLDHTLMALADPTRRAILQRLAQGEARVTELAQPFAMSLNAVSKHIQMLERARLVRRRRAGREHFLSFNPEPLDEAATWIEAQRAFWTARLDALDDLLQAEDRAASTTPERKDDLDER
jgi:DNA-binding transcriptional ArsR family regulator